MTTIAEKVAHVLSEARKGQTRDHECHAEGCPVQVPPAIFMCRRHWYMVPKPLRDAIWRLYNAGQEKGDVGVSREYLHVTREAIAAVKAKEAEGPKQRKLFR